MGLILALFAARCCSGAPVCSLSSTLTPLPAASADWRQPVSAAPCPSSAAILPPCVSPSQSTTGSALPLTPGAVCCLGVAPAPLCGATSWLLAMAVAGATSSCACKEAAVGARMVSSPTSTLPVASGCVVLKSGATAFVRLADPSSCSSRASGTDAPTTELIESLPSSTGCSGAGSFSISCPACPVSSLLLAVSVPFADSMIASFGFCDPIPEQLAGTLPLLSNAFWYAPQGCSCCSMRS
jgi:hypothetical protein